MENEAKVVLAWLLEPWALYAVALLGMLAHFLKLKWTGESATAILRYFGDHFRSTLIAWIATSVGFAAYVMTLKTGMPADIVLVFLAGYTCDSAFNKWTGMNGNGTEVKP